MPEFETITVTVEGARGRIELARPEKLNPLSVTTLLELRDAAAWFDGQAHVRVVIVEGAGRAFSAGADLDSFMKELTGGVAGRAAADAGRQMADAIELMRPVSIAAIRGVCVGGGLVLAASCDLRVAGDDTYFSIPEVDLGIPLAWGGIPRLVREIGPALTKELVMTCRPFTAAEAKAAGFLNQVLPSGEVSDAVAALATEIEQRPQLAVSATKRHVNAVTAQMVGTDRSWADADGLLAALADPEGRARAAEYLRRVNR